ncbi:MAG: hypothetical protein AB7G93_00160 [Bdellovibrionales bacterium]
MIWSKWATFMLMGIGAQAYATAPVLIPVNESSPQEIVISEDPQTGVIEYLGSDGQWHVAEPLQAAEVEGEARVQKAFWGGPGWPSQPPITVPPYGVPGYGGPGYGVYAPPQGLYYGGVPYPHTVIRRHSTTRERRVYEYERSESESYGGVTVGPFGY